MRPTYLITLALGILLVRCTSSPSETPVQEQDARKPSEEFLITPDVVCGHKFGMALTFDVYQPRQRNGAAVIFVNSGGWVSFFPNFFEQTSEGPRSSH